MPNISAVPGFNRHDADLRRLAAISAAGISTAGLLLIAIIAFAGLSSNQSSTERERILLQNALNRSVARVLNEQKSVAWWDDAVINLGTVSQDLEWVHTNFGIYLSETYGHDEIYILSAEDRALYTFVNGERGEAAAFERHRLLLAPIVSKARASKGSVAAQTTLKVRPDAFGADQSSYRTIGGPVDTAQWAGHIISVDGKLAIVAALTVVPNVDMSLLSGPASLLISVTYIDDELVTGIGRALLLDDLKLAGSIDGRGGVVSEPFVGDDGAHAGYLTWTTQRPGQVLLKFILPLVIFGVVAVALLASRMLRRLQRSSNELAEREMQSRHDASHDALSALANRSYFAEKLQEALGALSVSREETRAIVAYIDIDNFKDVNDTLGHQAGDELIKMVASRLRVQMRPDSLLSRYGGDEFAILWPNAVPQAGAALAKRIHEAFAHPFEVSEQRLFITASAGIAISAAQETTGDELMRQADIALYEAKSRGRNRAVFFSDDMARQVQERRAIELDLRAALDGDEMRLNYQPIISCATGAISGVEALLRWRHPARGEVPPAMFIPVAEQCGLMPALGEWVLSRAMRDAALWPHLQVSINLSPVQFRQDDLEGLLKRLVEKHQADPTRIVLEITEGVLMETSERTSRTLDAIHDMGFQTALDDFGTGYSSLSYLCNFRFDKIKVDRSFVAGMAKSERYEKIVHAVIALGRGLDMNIVAEGVETLSEVNTMTELGCTELQGYYFSRPVECDQMIRLVETHVPHALQKHQTSVMPLEAAE